MAASEKATAMASPASICSKVAASLYGAGAETPPASQRQPTSRGRLTPLPEVSTPSKRPVNPARPAYCNAPSLPRITAGQALRIMLVLFVALGFAPFIGTSTPKNQAAELNAPGS